MKVGVVIGRIGGEDGVALETEKWIHVLGDLGHEVRVLTGLLEGELAGVTLLPAMSFDDPGCVEEQDVAFLGGDGDGAAIERSVVQRAEVIADGIRGWVDREGIDGLLVENAAALPFHVALGLGVRLACERTELPTVTHDHDFAWERGDRYHTPFPGIRDIVDATFPLRLPTVRHAVINTAAREALQRRYGIEAAVVPNVMDFDAPFARRDDYNAHLRPDFALTADDVLLFQITRVVRRKGIETAIELVGDLHDPRVKLVITGTARDDDTGYHRELELLVQDLDLGRQVIFAGDRFDNHRGLDDQGRRIYSLSDAYAHADACTYFSTYEGFGNAFVEAVLARRPIFVNDYEPVYGPDIASKGFEAVTIHDSQLTAGAVEAIRAVLDDPAQRARIAEHNYRLGQRHFSYDNLRQLLGPLFSWAAVLMSTLLILGCKPDPTEDPPGDDDTGYTSLAPAITLDSPDDGTIGTADTVEVTGTVTGNYDHIRIAGEETLAFGGQFAVDVPIDPQAPFTPLLAEVWGDHGWARDRRTYVRGARESATAPIDDGLAARVTDRGIDAIQAYVATMFTAEMIAATIRDTDPLYTGEIVGTAIVLDATDASVGALFLDLDARHEGLVLNATLTDVTLHLSLDADWAGVWTGVVTADACVLESTVVLSATGSDLQVTAQEPTVSLVGLNVDFDGIWSWIEDGLESLLLDMLQDTLAGMIGTDVVGAINDALAGLQSAFSFETITLGGSFVRVQHDDQGVNLWLDVELDLAGASGVPEYRVSVEGGSPALSGDTTPGHLPYGAQVVLDDDALNALGVGLHASGLMDLTIEGELPGDIGITLTAGMFKAMFPSMEDVLDDGDPLTLTTPSTIPMIGRAAEGPEDAIDLYIPGFRVAIAGDIDGDGSADPLYDLVVDGRLRLGVDAEDGDLAIDADQVEAKLLSCTIECAANEGEDLATLVDVLMGMAVGVLTSDLMNIIEGMTLVPLEGGACGPSGDHAALYADLVVD